MCPELLVYKLASLDVGGKTGHFISNVSCGYISALVLTCYRLTKSRATFFLPETIVASFLDLMVLSFKVIFNHTSKRQYVVLHFRIIHFRQLRIQWKLFLSGSALWYHGLPQGTVLSPFRLYFTCWALKKPWSLVFI